jgi:HEAT repeat protein
MAEPTETRKLSGLARSIDALFAVPAAPARTPPPTPIEAPPVALDEGTGVAEPEPVPAWQPPAAAPTLVTPAPPHAVVTPPPPSWAAPAPEPPPARPQPAEMFPASQMLDAIRMPLPFAPEPGGAADTVVSEPAWSAPAPAEEPMLEIASAPPATAPSPGVRGTERLDENAFARAVDDYVIGDMGMRNRVETLAEGLKERLALDPLADAVEKLVRAAGDPPDTRHLDLAGAVINPAVASRLVQRLGQETEEPRRQEYFALCRRLGRVMANALKGALTGALERDVRRVYYDALISMGSSVRPMIEGMVADENRFLVRDAVSILGEIGGPRAVELVTSTLADTDPRVRAEALLALGRLGDATAGQVVLGSLEDPDPAVRLAAADASGRLGLERALRPLLHMLEAAENPDDIVALLRALGQIGDPGAVSAIEKHAVPSLFSKPSTDVRVAAYRALHAIGSPHARDLIRQTAQDKDPGVRVALRDLAREA